MLWQVDIYPATGQKDQRGRALTQQVRELHLGEQIQIAASHGYLLEGPGDKNTVSRIAAELLVDGVVESARIGLTSDAQLMQFPGSGSAVAVHVLPKPGVMDPVAQSALGAIHDLGENVTQVRTLRKYWIQGATEKQLSLLCQKLLANDAIEQTVVGPLPWEHLELGRPFEFALKTVSLLKLSDEELTRLSREGQLYLSLEEMRTIQAHFRELGREPTDIELESVAQTWSEHCSHKTLAGRIRYQDDEQERVYDNMLKETIFAATQQLRKQWGSADWCVSVFKDNAGIVRFEDDWNVCFKVETHNHPSALEPYGGANTGIGGVIRDPLGTGMGARPICNTDVFCFAPPDTQPENVPAGALHPRRVMQGVVSGVRDYGNRMGIPTVNGAVFFDRRYLGNPLVYCGTVGMIPADKSFKEPQPGDWIVALGGRTGRDGIHGATFSSAELTHESESLSGGAVQIGNAITEKMVLDVILQARDQNLYNAITDCGAGGFSSAVGEMGEEIGAEVWLDRAPLKYDGLSYTEIWISEAQERMILAVPEEKWQALHALCQAEDVEATILGRFEPTSRLRLLYQGHEVGNLSMEFLHGGRPPVVREATYAPAKEQPFTWPVSLPDHAESLHKILGSLNVASKHWVIRQYDHEVQAGSVVKPLVGVQNDGPSDAAVVRPLPNSNRGLAISCGMNPHYGDFDTYHMAASAIDEAIRNCVAVGANPARIAILDNFCWGNTDRPNTLGSLVRAAMACSDLAREFGTPFISGKDSLNNEFRFVDEQGQSQSIAIPPSLLISALGQVEDVQKCVTMDLKKAGNLLFAIGRTLNEMGGSHYGLTHGLSGGKVPKVDLRAKAIYLAMHRAIHAGLVRACHDLSEGGLAVALAEMAFAGGLGAEIALAKMPYNISSDGLDAAILFSESNTRFLCEVAPQQADAFLAEFSELSQHFGEPTHACIGAVIAEPELRITSATSRNRILQANLASLKAAWQKPLDW
jgi:phosphoribosylformylglycinamidine synthase